MGRDLTTLAAALALALAGACSTDEGSGSPGADTGAAQDEGQDAESTDTGGPDAPVPDGGGDAADAGPAPAPWQHLGPITTAAAAPPTGPYFVDVTEAAGITDVEIGHGRVQVVDLNGDLEDDLVTQPIQGGALLPRVLTHDGASGFVDTTAAAGIADAEMAFAAFADLDNDGDQDMLSALSFRAAEGTMGVWLQQDDGTLLYTGANGIAPVFLGFAGENAVYKEQAAAGFADFDGDGIHDLYIGTWRAGSPTVEGSYGPTDDELYLGDGTGEFQPAALPDQHNPLTSKYHPDLAGVPRAAYGLSLADFDDDGDLDVFVNNYGAGRPVAGSPPSYWEWNFLWRNDSAPGSLSFTDVSVEYGVAATERGIGGVQQETPVELGGVTYEEHVGGNGFGSHWADFDNDGDLDLVVGTIAHPDYAQSDRTMLHVNRQTEGQTFTEESAERGLLYAEDELHPFWVDVDNDGRLDLAVSRLRETNFELYLQKADGTYDHQSYAESGIEVERPGPTAWLDYDGDGDLDCYIAKGRGLLYENQVGQANGWLELRFVAKAPRDATGTRVTLTTSAGPQMREIVGTGSHYNNQRTRAAYFGLGGDSGAADVQIRWPDGEVQALGDVKANQRLLVTQGGEIQVF